MVISYRNDRTYFLTTLSCHATHVPALNTDGRALRLLNLEEARATAPCAVNLDRTTVLLPKGAPRVCEEVARIGFNVLDIDFSAHAHIGGGIRCATAVVYREID